MATYEWSPDYSMVIDRDQYPATKWTWTAGQAAWGDFAASEPGFYRSPTRREREDGLNHVKADIQPATYQQLKAAGLWNLTDPNSDTWKYLQSKAGNMGDVKSDPAALMWALDNASPWGSNDIPGYEANRREMLAGLNPGFVDPFIAAGKQYQQSYAKGLEGSDSITFKNVVNDALDGFREIAKGTAPIWMAAAAAPLAGALGGGLAGAAGSGAVLGGAKGGLDGGLEGALQGAVVGGAAGAAGHTLFGGAGGLSDVDLGLAVEPFTTNPSLADLGGVIDSATGLPLSGLSGNPVIEGALSSASGGSTTLPSSESLVGPQTGTMLEPGVQQSGALASPAAGSGSPVVTGVATGAGDFLPAAGALTGGAGAGTTSHRNPAVVAQEEYEKQTYGRVLSDSERPPLGEPTKRELMRGLRAPSSIEQSSVGPQTGAVTGPGVQPSGAVVSPVGTAGTPQVTAVAQGAGPFAPVASGALAGALDGPKTVTPPSATPGALQPVSASSPPVNTADLTSANASSGASAALGDDLSFLDGLGDPLGDFTTNPTVGALGGDTSIWSDLSFLDGLGDPLGPFTTDPSLSDLGGVIDPATGLPSGGGVLEQIAKLGAGPLAAVNKLLNGDPSGLAELAKLGVPAALIAGLFEKNESPLLGPMTDAARAAMRKADEFSALPSIASTPGQLEAISLAKRSTGAWSPSLTRAGALADQSTVDNTAYDPYFDKAGEFVDRGARATTAWKPYFDKAEGGVPGMNLDAYLNPYVKGALDVSAEQVRKTAADKRIQQNAGAAMKGAFGGSRAAVMQGALDRSEMDAIGDLYTTGLSGAYDRATGLANTDLNRLITMGGKAGDLETEELNRYFKGADLYGAMGGKAGDFEAGDRTREANAATLHTNIGKTRGALDTMDFDRLSAAGALERQPLEDQRQKTADAARLYTGVVHGTAPAIGATTPPSKAGQVAGALGALGEIL